MSSTTTIGPNVIKSEGGVERAPTTPQLLSSMDAATASKPTSSIDPKDPESFLRRCAGYNKKNGVRCSASIGVRNSHHTKNSHPTFLPTCHIHKDQQSFAGWCQFMQGDGERCGRIFRWTPPYLELCNEHQGHPNTPCYFLALPLELRLEVFRYLLPSQPIGSSTALVHAKGDETVREVTSPYRPRAIGNRRWLASAYEQTTLASVFETPLLNLLLVNKQMCAEVKDLIYSTVPFKIDIRKDGAFMCGRHLLEPKNADGSSHERTEGAHELKAKFLKSFDWVAAKNYNVDILVENCESYRHQSDWDEEVEIYDIRDYINVVVSGILSKARTLCKLRIRLGISKFGWIGEELLANIKTLMGPFERLRNVRQPCIAGIYDSSTYDGNYGTVLNLPLPVRPGRPTVNCPPSTPISSVPSLPTYALLPLYATAPFQEFHAKWQLCISSPSSSSLIPRPPVCAMFSQFKQFYTQLASALPGYLYRGGKHAFLHRARVARDQENVGAFRLLMDELVQFWYSYIEQEDQKRSAMNRLISKTLDADTYPASREENVGSGKRIESKSSAPGSSLQSPIELDVDIRNTESTGSQGNAEHYTRQILRTQALDHREQQKRWQILEKSAPVEAQELCAQQRELQQRQRDLEARRSREAHEFRLEQAHLEERKKILEQRIYAYKQQQQKQHQQQQQHVGCNMQRPYVHPVSPNTTQQVQPPLEMGQDQGMSDPNDAQVTASLNIPKMPTVLSQDQQNYRSMFGSTSSSDFTNVGASISSPSSSLSSTARSSWSTNQAADALTPPTPTQQVQFADNVMSWHNRYETPASSGESSKAWHSQSRANLYDGLPGPINDVGNTHMSSNIAHANASKRRSVASDINRGSAQVDENGDEIMTMDDNYVDIFRGWVGQQEHFVGKGKGKRKALAHDEVETGSSEEANGIKRQHQMYMGKGKGRAVNCDPEVVFLG
jgi:hypothetical protein